MGFFLVCKNWCWGFFKPLHPHTKAYFISKVKQEAKNLSKNIFGVGVKNPGGFWVLTESLKNARLSRSGFLTKI